MYALKKKIRTIASQGLGLEPRCEPVKVRGLAALGRHSTGKEGPKAFP